MAEPIQMMIEDLGKQIAQKSIEAAEWKTRATLAEAAVEELKAAQEVVEEEQGEAVLASVPDEEPQPEPEEEEAGE